MVYIAVIPVRLFLVWKSYDPDGCYIAVTSMGLKIIHISRQSYEEYDFCQLHGVADK